MEEPPCGMQIDNYLFIFILTDPPSFPVSPPSVGVTDGQDAKLECNPDSNPPAVITWRTPTGLLISGTGNEQIIRKVRQQDTGEYQCRAENDFGSTSAKVTLSIGSKSSLFREFT